MARFGIKLHSHFFSRQNETAGENGKNGGKKNMLSVPEACSPIARKLQALNLSHLATLVFQLWFAKLWKKIFGCYGLLL